jgi:hypothetical protein
MKRTVKKTMKRYANGGSSLDTRPVQNAPKVTITPAAKKPVSKAEAPKAKPTPKPAAKTPAKKPATKPTYSAVKDIKSRMYPNTGVPKPGVGVRATTKPKPTTTTKPKPAGKTVSQVWAEKTGTSWSEAKKLGLTDGSAKSNLALLDKLKKGTVSKSSIADMKNPPKREKEETIPTLSVKGTTVTKSNASPSTSSSTSETTPKPTKDQMSGSGLGASERMEGMYKKGGSVKKKMKLKKK